MDEWDSVNTQVNYVKPSQLKIGDAIVGIFKETTTDAKYGTLKHHILQEDGSFKIINGSGQLNHVMKSIAAETKVRIEFAGKSKLESGKFKGTDANQWKVFRAKVKTEQAKPIDNGSDFSGRHPADRIKEETFEMEVPF